MVFLIQNNKNGFYSLVNVIKIGQYIEQNVLAEDLSHSANHFLKKKKTLGGSKDPPPP